MKRGVHTKSRSGCKRCKTRKVKCDEARPCTACVKHRVRCSLAPDVPPPPENYRGEGDGDGFVNHFAQDFIGPATQSSTARASSARSSSSSPKLQNTAGCMTLATVPHPPRLLSDARLGSGDNWLSNLELLHHFKVTAHSTMSSSRVANRTLQIEVMKLGLDHGFLLQQILAFSGFHLSYACPEKQQALALKASCHQTMAIAGFRKALAQEITPENCDALFSCALMLHTSAFAALPSQMAQNEDFSAIDSIVDMMKLSHGMAIIMGNGYGPLRRGPLKNIFAVYPRAPLPMPERTRDLLNQMKAFKTYLQTLNTGAEAEQLEDCIFMVGSMIDMMLRLHDTTGITDASSAEMQALFAWPMTLTDKHILLCRSRHPFALATIAYYGVLLHHAAGRYWFLEGWAQTLLDDLRNKLGGTDYEGLIEWQMNLTRQEPGKKSYQGVQGGWPVPEQQDIAM